MESNQTSKIKQAIIIMYVIAALVFFGRIFVVNRLVGVSTTGYLAPFYELYVFVLLISYLTISKTVERLVLSRKERGQIRNCFLVFRCSLLVVLIMSLFIAMFFVFGAKTLSMDFLKIPIFQASFRWMGLLFVFLGLSACIRGLLNAFDTEVSIAIAEIVIQVIGAIVSILVALIMGKRGIRIGALIRNNDCQFIFAARGCVIGLVVSSGVAFCVFVFLYLSNSARLSKLLRKDSTIRDENSAEVASIYLRKLLPRIALIGLFLLHGLFALPYLYHSSTLSSDVVDVGSYYAGVRTVILIPLCMLILSTKYANEEMYYYIKIGEPKRNREVLQSRFRYLLLFAIPMFLYHILTVGNTVTAVNGKPDASAAYLGVPMAFLLLIYVFAIPSAKALFCMRKKRYLGISLLLGNIVFFVILMLAQKKGGVTVELLTYASIAFGLTVAVLNQLFLIRFLHYRQEWTFSVFLPYIAATGTMIIVGLVHLFLEGILPALVLLILSLLIAFFVYFIALGFMRGLHPEELDEIPFGHILYMIYDRLGIVQEEGEE